MRSEGTRYGPFIEFAWLVRGDFVDGSYLLGLGLGRRPAAEPHTSSHRDSVAVVDVDASDQYSAQGTSSVDSDQLLESAEHSPDRSGQ